MTERTRPLVTLRNGGYPVQRHFHLFFVILLFFSVLAKFFEVYVINAGGQGMLSDFAQVVDLIAVLWDCCEGMHCWLTCAHSLASTRG